MEKRGRPVLLRSIEDLADAKELRSVISTTLTRAPIDESALRCAVWSFVGTERRAGVPPALVITRLTSLIDEAAIAPISLRASLTRGVILWCVEEYFGRLGGDVLAGDVVEDDLEDDIVEDDLEDDILEDGVLSIAGRIGTMRPASRR